MSQTPPPPIISPQQKRLSSRQSWKQTIRCPRCGYDQRGKIQQWVDSCPLQGLCTECGLEFDWCELLSSEFAKPGWCVEYFDSWIALPWRSVKTLIRTFWPFGFWRSLKMSHEIRLRRIAAYLILMLATCYVWFCLAHGALAWGVWNQSSALSFRTGGIRGTMMGPKVDIDDVITAMFVPWSNKAPSMPAPPGWGMTTLNLQSPRSLLRYDWTTRLIPEGLLLLTHCFAAFWFITLPISRRRAKVRWGHISRIFLYGLVLVLPIIILMLPAEALQVQNMQILFQTGQLLDTLAGICQIAFLPMLIIWWSTATGRYLKMRHAWAVGVMMVVLASLTTLIIYAGMTGYLLMGWKMYL